MSSITSTLRKFDIPRGAIEAGAINILIARGIQRLASTGSASEKEQLLVYIERNKYSGFLQKLLHCTAPSTMPLCNRAECRTMINIIVMLHETSRRLEVYESRLMYAIVFDLFTYILTIAREDPACGFEASVNDMLHDIGLHLEQNTFPDNLRILGT